ncbi:MAG: TetR/AcrR family transcriptional regulator [bacterium]|nr:TetR/AcrR family transcriptional regulator [bacterium]
MSSRREKEKAERRKNILRNAQVLFAEKGYLGTSMAEIAEASEFAVGSLYSFFKSKEEILATIFEVHIEHVLAGVTSVRNDARLEPREKIETCLDLLVRIYVDNQDFFRIYIAEARGVEWGVRTEVGEYIQKGTDQYIDILRDIFQEGIDREFIEPGLDPEFLAHLLRSFVHSTVIHFLYSGRDLTMDKLLGIARHMVFHGICRQEKKEEEDDVRFRLFPDSDA